MTLNDLERCNSPYFALFSPNSQSELGSELKMSMIAYETPRYEKVMVRNVWKSFWVWTADLGRFALVDVCNFRVVFLVCVFYIFLPFLFIFALYTLTTTTTIAGVLAYNSYFKRESLQLLYV